MAMKCYICGQPFHLNCGGEEERVGASKYICIIFHQMVGVSRTQAKNFSLFIKIMLKSSP